MCGACHLSIFIDGLDCADLDELDHVPDALGVEQQPRQVHNLRFVF